MLKEYTVRMVIAFKSKTRRNLPLSKRDILGIDSLDRLKLKSIFLKSQLVIRAVRHLKSRNLYAGYKVKQIKAFGAYLALETIKVLAIDVPPVIKKRLTGRARFAHYIDG